jgi:uncharacterized membrane protein (UPF0136 family)
MSKRTKTVVGILAALFAGIAAAQALRYINVGQTINLVVAVAAAVVLVLLFAITWLIGRRSERPDAP